jgi:hypothetical protein
MRRVACKFALVFCAVVPHGIATADSLCGASEVAKGVTDWNTGQYLFNCLAQGGNDPGPIVIPPQSAAYRVEVLWGGFDKSNGTPNGEIKLLVGTDAPRGTVKKHMPESGDDDKTWRWNGTVSIVVPAGVQRKFKVHHDTTNGTAGNTYLRIKFVSSD